MNYTHLKTSFFDEFSLKHNAITIVSSIKTFDLVTLRTKTESYSKAITQEGIKKDIKIVLLFIFTLILNKASFAQDLLPAFSTEITYKNNIAYFQNAPFTGLLVDAITNKQMGQFSNGKKNGLYTEYYENGKKKKEGTYKLGVVEGVFTNWYDNGNKLSEYNFLNGKQNGDYTQWFSNGQKQLTYIYLNGSVVDGKYTIYAEDGQAIKEETYKNGVKISEGTFKEGKLIEWSTEFYKPGGAKKNEGMLINGIRDSLWIEYFESGQKKSEGHYIEGKEDGNWTWYYENGDKRKVVKFENGIQASLIYENNVDPSLSINNKLTSNSYLYMVLSGFAEDTAFVMVTLNFQQTGNYKIMANEILSGLNIRFGKPLNKTESNTYGKRMLGYSIEFTNAKEATFYDNGNSGIKAGNQTIFQMIPGYRGRASATMRIQDLKKNTVIYNGIIADTSSIYPTTNTSSGQESAAQIAPTLLKVPVINKAFQAFPLKTDVSHVIEFDKKGYPKTMMLMCGANRNIDKGFQFYIYSTNNYSKILGTVKIIEVQDKTSTCKVMENEEIISQHLNNGEKLIAISIYKL